MAEEAELPGNVLRVHRALLRNVAARRDRRAFELVYRHYVPLLMNWLERRGATHQSAEELAQDVMLQVWRDAHTYDPRHDPGAWIFGMTRDLWRAASTGIVVVEPAAAHEHFERVGFDAGTELPEAVIGHLSEDERHALSVVIVDGKSHMEAADLLGVPIGTLKSRIKRAMDRLRRLTSRSGAAMP